MSEKSGESGLASVQAASVQAATSVPEQTRTAKAALPSRLVPRAPVPVMVEADVEPLVGLQVPPAVPPSIAGVLPVETLPAASRPSRAYLLLETPGPWQADALQTLPPAVAERLRAFGKTCDVEVVLIRRPGGQGPHGHVLFLSTPDADGLVVQRSLSSLIALGSLNLAADLASVRDGSVPAGWSESDALVAVATHASVVQRQRGRGVAMRLASQHPDMVWESSHACGPTSEVGALLLPSGQLHTRLEVASVSCLLAASWQSRVPLESFVGRAHHEPALRLAEVTLRRLLGAEAEAAVEALDAGETRIATGTGDDSGTSITRVFTRWRVFPNLVQDVALARMVPDRDGETASHWRVIVDRSSLAGDDEHLSVIEVADDADPGRGAHAWDAAHADAQGPVPLPDPTVVAEVTPLPAGRALDLGCGSGRHALWLAANRWQVTGVDFSRSGLWRMADEACARALGVRAELADIATWTPGGARYDLVLVSHLQLDEPFQRVAAWLNPQGRAIVIGPAATAPDGTPGLDVVRLAARATGARLRVLRAGTVERMEEGRPVRDAIVVAERPL